ncbi:glycosyltransferase family 2 protein [Candidatus Haliotispira prima]|uniref:Glycosyltransferase family 2 protein n=1 Tax=Candidatus Haliotispira prima TaxID=3034016 RepID=A0ABY8MIX6_9SPIO|nr:glycosyltransferase family 2 protein [Candidatus Haliotispira prima]
MSSIKVSIIIPVYNVERYLRECLESVINQTLEQIQIIIVNDASPDNSWKIIEEYKNRNPKIEVLTHEQNLGANESRNTGLSAVKGQYIFFLDNDDTISLDACEKLYNIAVQHDADIVGCPIRRTDISNTETLRTDYFNNKEIREYIGEDIYQAYFRGLISITIAAKLYKLDIWNRINSVEIPSGTIHEDNYLFFDLTGVCHRFVQTNYVCYNHRQHNKSITGRVISEKYITDCLIVLKKQKDFFASGNFKAETLKNSANRIQHALRAQCILPNNMAIYNPETIRFLLHKAPEYGLEEEVITEIINCFDILVTGRKREPLADWWYQFGQKKLKGKAKMIVKRVIQFLAGKRRTPY